MSEHEQYGPCAAPECGHLLEDHSLGLFNEPLCNNGTCSCVSYLRPDGEVWVNTTPRGSFDALFNVHPAVVCKGRPCALHNPSEHELSGAPLDWRGDRRIMERVCQHGVGHPDPDDAAYRASKGDHDTVHGCDGCCAG